MKRNITAFTAAAVAACLTAGSITVCAFDGPADSILEKAVSTAERARGS